MTGELFPITADWILFDRGNERRRTGAAIRTQATRPRRGYRTAEQAIGAWMRAERLHGGLDVALKQRRYQRGKLIGIRHISLDEYTEHLLAYIDSLPSNQRIEAASPDIDRTADFGTTGPADFERDLPPDLRGFSSSPPPPPKRKGRR